MVFSSVASASPIMSCKATSPLGSFDQEATLLKPGFQVGHGVPNYVGELDLVVLNGKGKWTYQIFAFGNKDGSKYKVNVNRYAVEQGGNIVAWDVELEPTKNKIIGVDFGVTIECEIE